MVRLSDLTLTGIFLPGINSGHGLQWQHLLPDLVDPSEDELHLPQAQVKAEPVEELLGRKLSQRLLQASDAGLHLRLLSSVDVAHLPGPVAPGEIEPGKEFEADAAGTRVGS